MKMTGKTLILTKDEANALAHLLERRAAEYVGQAFTDHYFDPDFLNGLAHCLGAGHTIKVSAK